MGLFFGRRLEAWLYYPVTALLTLLGYYVFVAQGDLRLAVPFSYSGDFFIQTALIKTVMRGGGIPYLTLIQSADLGAPAGFTMGDFPLPEQMQFLVMKALSLFSSDPIVVYNVYYLLGFVLTAVIFLYVLRSFRVAFPIASMIGILYSFIGYHLLRYNHLLLAGYYLTPLAMRLILTLWAARPPLLRRGPGGTWRLDLFSPRNRGRTLFLLFAASWHIYYAFFLGIFLAMAGVAGALYRRSRAPLYSTGIMGALLLTSVVGVLMPTLVYRSQHGPNPQVATRQSSESETYALKVTNLLLPHPAHRISPVSHMAANYVSGTPHVEGFGESIGLTGAFGFLVLVAYLWNPRRRNSILDKLSLLTVGGVLYASIGGFAALFALWVSPQIRAPNRINPYLACFAFTALALLLNRWLRPRLGRASLAGVALGLVIFGLYDLVSYDLRIRLDRIVPELESDRSFFRELETRVPPQTTVLQLPYLAFPEVPPIHRLEDYGHLRAYLMSDTLRWSYGATKGRPGADAIEAVSRSPLDASRIRDMGYAGIYVDRRGYADGGKQIEAELSRIGGRVLLESPDKNLVYFKL